MEGSTSELTHECKQCFMRYVPTIKLSRSASAPECSALYDRFGSKEKLDLHVAKFCDVSTLNRSTKPTQASSSTASGAPPPSLGGNRSAGVGGLLSFDEVRRYLKDSSNPEGSAAVGGTDSSSSSSAEVAGMSLAEVRRQLQADAATRQNLQHSVLQTLELERLEQLKQLKQKHR
jgi:hypothetical protein